MAVLDVLVAPHPILAAKARAVKASEFGAALVALSQDMAETMYAAPGVGLAAPQIGDSRQFLVMDSGLNPDEGGHGFLCLVNPQIVERSDETIPWAERCLSVPELEVTVQRARNVLVAYADAATGEPKQVRLCDYEAVIVQHEMDHLTGTILLDRVSPFRRRRWIKSNMA